MGRVRASRFIGAATTGLVAALVAILAIGAPLAEHGARLVIGTAILDLFAELHR